MKIIVNAPARLHMGFIDLSGALGRNFGSIGLALNEINTRLTMTASSKCEASGPAKARAIQSTRMLCKALDVSDHVQVEISAAIPEHVGLGSGTQMSLAIGMALNKFYELGLTVREIAELTARGKRSGIGIGVFEQGGLVVDGGRGENTVTPPVIARMQVPEDWRFILIFDRRGQGLHGEKELQAFKALPAFPQQEAQRLCYLLVMQALPAIAEQDLQKFGDVITQLQQSVGGHFSSAQGGIFTSQEVAEVIAWLQQQGAVGIGQTSWGPTGFCIIEGEDRAHEIINLLQQQFAHFENLSFISTSARNSGGDVSVE